MLSEKSIINFRCGNGNQKTCPVCNKTFQVTYATTYAYKKKGVYFCSYSCWRKGSKK